jgi:hypothetical protein
MHYLDFIRHDFAFAWAWYNWITNVTAGIVVFFFGSLFWPRARRAYKVYFEKHISGLHAKLDQHHEAVLAQAEGHHEQHMEILKKHHAELMNSVKPKPPVRKAVVKKAVPK